MHERILYSDGSSRRNKPKRARSAFRQKVLLSILFACSLLEANAAPPSISYPPKDLTVVLNQPAGFGVIASGTAPLKYQWFKEGVAMVGATNDHIAFGRAQFSNAGRYSVLVSNAEDRATSPEAVLSVRLPSAGDVDGSFAIGGSVNGAAGESVVEALALQQNGKVLIAGGFATVNGAMRGRIARLNSDGSTDFAFMNGFSGADDWVDSIALQSDDKIVIGGSFMSINGTSRGRIARLNADGTLDESFQNGTSGANSGVYSIAIQPDGKVVIGGDFTTIDGIGRNHIARLNNDGALDDSFQNGLSGVDGTIYCVALQPDGKVLIGGNFTSVNGANRNRVARLNVDGSVDNSFLNGLSGANGYVSAMVLQSDGKVLIGGYFSSVNGTSRGRIARLNADGTLDNNFLNGLPGANDIVDSVAVQSDGKVLIGGGFILANGVRLARLARLNSDGTLDGGFQSGLAGADNSVLSMAVQGDGKVLIGGSFGTVNGAGRSRVARLNADGTLDGSFNNGSSGVSSRGLERIEGVNSVAVQSDGKVLLGGSFTSVNGISRNNLVRLNINGTLDNFQNALFGPNGAVHSIAIDGNGRALIAGEFTSVNGVSRGRVARLNSDGSVDLNGFLAGLMGANSNVYVTTLQSDGKILIGGDFTSVNLTGRSRIARLNSDGVLDSGFLNGLSGVNGSVYAVAIQTDNKVLLGGNFTSVNGTNRSRIARLNANGTVDNTFLNGLTGADAFVASLVVQGDGKVLVGGGFTRMNGTSRNGIARLNTDGTVDNSFAGSGTDYIVESIAMQSDGKIVIGGSFTTVNGAPRNRIARLNVDGTIDDSFQTGSSGVSEEGVRSVVIQSDGRILIGGNFTSVNGIATGSIARIWASEMPFSIQSIAVGQGSVTLIWNTLPNHTYRVRYSPILPATEWTDLPGDITATGDIATKTDTTIGTSLRRFYRIFLVQ